MENPIGSSSGHTVLAAIPQFEGWRPAERLGPELARPRYPKPGRRTAWETHTVTPRAQFVVPASPRPPRAKRLALELGMEPNTTGEAMRTSMENHMQAAPERGL